jgi:hypothetical protein
MKASRRIRVIAVVEARRFVARAAMRARARTADSTRTPPRFRQLSEIETETLLGGELLAALSGARPRL